MEEASLTNRPYPAAAPEPAVAPRLTTTTMVIYGFGDWGTSAAATADVYTAALQDHRRHRVRAHYG